jgi:hypothetical protein
MATLDISGALQAMVSAGSPQARLENNLATAMFATQVNNVVNEAIDKLEASSKSTHAMSAAGDITPEQAQAIVLAREAQLANAQKFASRYFG